MIQNFGRLIQIDNLVYEFANDTGGQAFLACMNAGNSAEHCAKVCYCERVTPFADLNSKDSQG